MMDSESSERQKRAKQNYANKCFGLPVEQIRYYEELTAKEKAEVAELFGKIGGELFVYAVKTAGGIVAMRERKRPEWE